MEPTQEPRVEFQWDGFEPGDPDADEVLYRLKREGAEAAFPPSEQRDFAIIPIIVGAIALFGLAKAIKGFIDDMRVGMVIDARSEPVKVTKDPSLGRGTVLLISKDGSVSLENPSAEKITDLIKGVVSGLK